MTRERRILVAVTLAALLAGSAFAVSVIATSAAVPDDPGETNTGDESRSASTQYKVSLDNATVRTWLLRNSTVLNATVEEAVIRTAATTDGNRTNVTLTNATVGRFAIDRGRLKNVTAETLVVRNRSVLEVPGGDLIDPDVRDRVIERHWTKNQTVSGLVIDRMVIDTAVLCESATLGEQADENASFDPTADDSDPAITVVNGSVGEALVIDGRASNWSVESVERPDATDGTLPDGCSRG